MAGFLCRNREKEIEKVIHNDVLFETPDITLKAKLEWIQITDQGGVQIVRT